MDGRSNPGSGQTKSERDEAQASTVLGLEVASGYRPASRQISSDVLEVQQGSLYPALHRLERRGWIRYSWGASESNRRAEFYELTKAGRKQLQSEESDWRTLVTAVAQILETA
jgi:transcriptional regulator